MDYYIYVVATILAPVGHALIDFSSAGGSFVYHSNRGQGFWVSGWAGPVNLIIHSTSPAIRMITAAGARSELWRFLRLSN